MDILYVVGKRLSGWNDNELRYSLRSIAKYGRNIGRVFIVGYAPAFVRRDSDEVVVVPFKDPTPDNKHYNILAAIEHVVYNTDIANRFLLSSDDHYYTQPVDFDAYPIYWRGHPIPETPNPRRWYDATLNSTREVLQAFELPYMMYAWHGNTHFDKRIFTQPRMVLLRRLAQTMPEACEPSCLMLNYWRAVSPDTMPVHERITDGKISTQTQECIDMLAQQKHVLSTTDAVGGQMQAWLQKTFPNKCQYERQ